ncbi:MAG: AI-2E family transporter [Candidatus Cloacimonetes bacterium]|nr:AI-2E family transporter [Candidatus Cloacimonadota bacterium]
MKLPRIFFTILMGLIIIAAFFFYQTVFRYIVLATIFAYILNPVVVFFESKGLCRVKSIVIVYIALIMIIGWSIYFLIPALIDQAYSVIDALKGTSESGGFEFDMIPIVIKMRESIAQLQAKLPMLDLDPYISQAGNLLRRFVVNAPQLLIDYSGNMLKAFSIIATMPIMGFFLLKDWHKFKKSIFSMIPNKYLELSMHLMEKSDQIVGRYLRALLVEIVIISALASTVLTIIGVKYSVLIGTLAGFANVIPYLGPWMGIIFAVLSVLITGKETIYILITVLGMWFVQIVDNNFVYPLVIGKNTEMHPLIVLLTVMAGGWAFGLTGMLFSVPVVYLIYGLVRELYIQLKEFEII